MNIMQRTFAAACVLCGSLAAQFQTNHPSLAMLMDGHGGAVHSFASALRSPCQAVGIDVVVAPRLQGRPMVLLVSPTAPVAGDRGAIRTPAGQWLNLDLGNTVALPGMSAATFRTALSLPAPASLSMQLLVLDPFAADGFLLSGPGHYRSAADTVVVTRPRVLGGKDGGLVQVALDGASSPLGGLTETPLGLAFDGNGRTFFGRARSESPLVVELIERGRDGQERDLGTVVDTRGGAYALGANGFDLLWMNDRLVFTHPPILTLHGGPGTSGSIRTLDPSSGRIETLVGGLGSPSGLALDDAGNLYYGVVDGHPQVIDVYRRDVNGNVTRITRAFDASQAHVAVGVWGFDVAVRGETLVFNLPTVTYASGRVQPGSIEQIDLRDNTRSVLVPSLGHPSGLSFDARGGLYYADAGFSPARARLFYRAAGANRSTDLGEIFNKTGGALPVGLWGIDVVVPCR